MSTLQIVAGFWPVSLFFLFFTAPVAYFKGKIEEDWLKGPVVMFEDWSDYTPSSEWLKLAILSSVAFMVSAAAQLYLLLPQNIQTRILLALEKVSSLWWLCG